MFGDFPPCDARPHEARSDAEHLYIAPIADDETLLFVARQSPWFMFERRLEHQIVSARPAESRARALKEPDRREARQKTDQAGERDQKQIVSNGETAKSLEHVAIQDP